MNINDYIASGVLEMYVLGISSKEESEEVERMSIAHPEIKKEIEEISSTLEKQAQQNKIAPHPAIKPLLIANISLRLIHS